MKAIYHPEFKASYDEAFAWYAGLSAQLSDRFRSEVRSGVSRVMEGRVTDAPGPHGFRCYRCKRFPYLIYYEIHGDAVLFLAVLYVGRAPGFLKAQLTSYTKKVPRPPA